jgi:hypothetical protein
MPWWSAVSASNAMFAGSRRAENTGGAAGDHLVEGSRKEKP